MIQRDEISNILEKYDKESITVATLGSHSALQILKGAREEGFRTLVLCKKGKEGIYERFRVTDKIVVLEEYKDILNADVQKRLVDENSILIPHGSLIAYVGVDDIENELKVPFLGNRKILRWEADRNLERQWLEKAGIKLPGEFKTPEEINTLSIIKFPGARGGKGYFLANNYEDFLKKSKEMLRRGSITPQDLKRATIQEYISGVNMYLSYFYSPLKKEVELFGIDRRYETNIDGLTRIPAADQVNNYIEPSYVVVGNIPITARESLLDEVLRMGDIIFKTSKEVAPPGMLGPFCLETMVTDDLEFIAFEISARIVAGTNPYTLGSPYSYILYGNNMSMGRRIALELKNALEQDEMEKLIS